MEDDDISYSYNQEEVEVIVTNNRLLHGTLARIQKELIELEYGEDDDEKPEEDAAKEEDKEEKLEEEDEEEVESEDDEEF